MRSANTGAPAYPLPCDWATRRSRLSGAHFTHLGLLSSHVQIMSQFLEQKTRPAPCVTARSTIGLTPPEWCGSSPRFLSPHLGRRARETRALRGHPAWLPGPTPLLSEQTAFPAVFKVVSTPPGLFSKQCYLRPARAKGRETEAPAPGHPRWSEGWN